MLHSCTFACVSSNQVNNKKLRPEFVFCLLSFKLGKALSRVIINNKYNKENMNLISEFSSMCSQTRVSIRIYKSVLMLGKVFIIVYYPSQTAWLSQSQ